MCKNTLRISEVFPAQLAQTFSWLLLKVELVWKRREKPGWDGCLRLQQQLCGALFRIYYQLVFLHIPQLYNIWTCCYLLTRTLAGYKCERLWQFDCLSLIKTSGRAYLLVKSVCSNVFVPKQNILFIFSSVGRSIQRKKSSGKIKVRRGPETATVTDTQKDADLSIQLCRDDHTMSPYSALLKHQNIFWWKSVAVASVFESGTESFIGRLSAWVLLPPIRHTMWFHRLCSSFFTWPSFHTHTLKWWKLYKPYQANHKRKKKL